MLAFLWPLWLLKLGQELVCLHDIALKTNCNVLKLGTGDSRFPWTCWWTANMWYTHFLLDELDCALGDLCDIKGLVLVVLIIPKPFSRAWNTGSKTECKRLVYRYTMYRYTPLIIVKLSKPHQQSSQVIDLLVYCGYICYTYVYLLPANWSYSQENMAGVLYILLYIVAVSSYLWDYGWARYCWC